jgi:hypothetical protein
MMAMTGTVVRESGEAVTEDTLRRARRESFMSTGWQGWWVPDRARGLRARDMHTGPK